MPVYYTQWEEGAVGRQGVGIRGNQRYSPCHPMSATGWSKATPCNATLSSLPNHRLLPKQFVWMQLDNRRHPEGMMGKREELTRWFWHQKLNSDLLRWNYLALVMCTFTSNGINSLFFSNWPGWDSWPINFQREIVFISQLQQKMTVLAPGSQANLWHKPSSATEWNNSSQFSILLGEVAMKF